MKCPVCGEEVNNLTTARISYSFMFKRAGREGYYCANMCDDCLNKIENILEQFRVAERRTRYEELKKEFNND